MNLSDCRYSNFVLEVYSTQTGLLNVKSDLVRAADKKINIHSHSTGPVGVVESSMHFLHPESENYYVETIVLYSEGK